MRLANKKNVTLSETVCKYWGRDKKKMFGGRFEYCGFGSVD
jgi:hypothetical protein